MTNLTLVLKRSSNERLKMNDSGPKSFYNLLLVATLLATILSHGYATKLKLCIVDGKGSFKKSSRYCPILDKTDSEAECILGIDRLDCLRRLSKGKADFAVFTPEDLVTATNSDIQVLITNELRYTQTNFEYEITAVIKNSAGIRDRHDLKGKRFCHPGYGYEADWTKILANYLEATIVPQTCDTKITITENRIKASSKYFGLSCKAGPWVSNTKLDKELKQRYRNLCQLCDHPLSCSTRDKYWGRRGNLFCLTDGAGDVSWARLDDIRVHFGLTPGGQESAPDDFSILCPDGKIMPVNTTNPCVWAAKPWPVVASRRSSAMDVQRLVSGLNYNNNTYSWQTALLNLIEAYHVSIEKVEPMVAIESYLIKAEGYLSANSFSGCHPPRTIKICTTSVIENAKCSWLREAAAVYGVEPDLDCILAHNTTHCMSALKNNAADIVVVPPDLLNLAQNEYSLQPLLYETGDENSKYISVAVTANHTSLKNFTHLNNKKACFPSYGGISWNSFAVYLKNQSSSQNSLDDYFESICAPNLPSTFKKSPKCDVSRYRDDNGALQCLSEGIGDVAFISKNSLPKFIEDSNNQGVDIHLNDFQTICNGNDCHLSWAPISYIMIRNSSSDLWAKDTLDVFVQLDSLFGKNFKTLTTPLQLFGPFDGKSDILFHDETLKLKNVPSYRNLDLMTKNYEDVLKLEKTLVSASIHLEISFVLMVLSIISVKLLL